MRIGSDSFQVMLVSQKGIRRPDEIAPEVGGHGCDHIFLP